MLRLVDAMPDPQPSALRVVGIDEYAMRKGRVYGTLLVDVETRRPVDLLPDREAAIVAAWLAECPEIEVVCRDRAPFFAEGASTGAPIAVQVADRARAEDRIRTARVTGLRNLPLHDGAQNRIWLEIVQIALDVPAWMPKLALEGPVRRWKPKRPRLRLFSAAAQLVTTGRRRILRLARHWPWTRMITAAFERLQALPNPG